jgi:glycosyltransferase involved in cell wall biosynthesis
LNRLESVVAHLRDADGLDGRTSTTSTLLTFVIPIKDEYETIVELRDTIATHVPADCDFEIIMIDDGSQDGSWTVIEELAKTYPNQVRGLRFRDNRGKAAALTAGFRAAQGDVIFTMDADLQDDPREIPRFLAKLDEGHDLVSGWKRVRHDPWHKVLPSRIFNRLLSFFGGVSLHDHNCGFKCYRAELATQMVLHGELHRMVPSLAAMRGFRSAEIEVRHHPRMFGRSKYGVERFLRGFSDMLTIGFLRRFRERPAHFMNAVSGLYIVVGTALAIAGMLAGSVTLKGLLLLLTGLLFGGMASAAFLVGLVCELCIRGPLTPEKDLPLAADTQRAFSPKG